VLCISRVFVELGDTLRNQETVSHGSIASAKREKRYCNCYRCTWKELFINTHSINYCAKTRRVVDFVLMKK